MDKRRNSSLLRAAAVLPEVRWVGTSLVQSSVGSATVHKSGSECKSLLPPEIVDPLEELKVTLQTEFDDKVRIAQETGFQEGLKRGQVMALEQAERATLDLKRAREEWMASIEAAFQKRQQILEHDAITLAFASVCQIVGKMSEKPEIVAQVVRQVLQKQRLDEQLRVRLSPADWHWMGFNLSVPIHEAWGLNWELDQQLTTGDCLIDNSSGTLDASLATQIHKLRTILLDVYKSRQNVFLSQESMDA